jgi:hypothetical protein
MSATSERRYFRLRQLVTAGLLVAGLAVGCGVTRTDPVGGETHFLRACDPSDDSCGAGLECLCNVCTAVCNAPSDCPNFPGAACVDTGSACQSSALGTCDVNCTADGDCAALSGSHVCENGVCRAGSGVDPNGSARPLACTAAPVPAGSTLIIGDNLLAGTNGVAPELDQLATDAGILQAGQGLKDDSSSTNDAFAYMGAGIAAQYAAGNPDGSVRLVVMTGGGVDAIFGTCSDVNAECPALVAAADAAQALLQRMADDGVEQVVYVLYPDPGNADQKARIDVLRSLLEPLCEQAPLPCYPLDLRPVFDGHKDDYVVPEGLTVAGAAAVANAIWTVLAECLSP